MNIFLPDIFDKYTKEVKENYLEVSGWQRFKLKPFCDSQKKSNTYLIVSLTRKADLYAMVFYLFVQRSFLFEIHLIKIVFIRALRHNTPIRTSIWMIM